MAGFAVFSVLGFMSQEQGVPIEEVAESGNAVFHENTGGIIRQLKCCQPILFKVA